MFDTRVKLALGNYRLSLDRPLVMGILNVTPDSFSDRTQMPLPEQAIADGVRLMDEGADIVDIGGESTRPGADFVSDADELARVIPIVQALAALNRCPISIDTRRASVRRAAVAAGAVLINDVAALTEPGSLQAAADLGVAVVLMHMQGVPATMQAAPSYTDGVLDSVARFLTERIFACQMAGIDKSKLLIDPGFGFGKTLEHNLTLLAELDKLQSLGVPILVGLSRKSMIGAITGRTLPSDRVAGSIAAAVIACDKGAKIIRTHDVKPTLDAIKVWAVLPKPVAKRVERGLAELF
jgi:dihydropteroate synthase